MAYTIPNKSCVGCDTCSFHCPTGAIKQENNAYWIDPTLCNNCEGYYPEPQCVERCPTHSPMPLQAKKGRNKVDVRELTSPDLFANKKTNPFASAIVIWEACNVLAQRKSLRWAKDESGNLCYQRQVNQGKGEITFNYTSSPFNNELVRELQPIEALDIRASCVHLIFAAHATALEQPWEQEFTLSIKGCKSTLEAVAKILPIFLI